MVAFACECRDECGLCGYSIARFASLWFFAGDGGSGGADSFCAGAQGVPVRFCGCSAVAFDWRRCGGARSGECARLGRGGSFVCGGFDRRGSECAAFPGAGVSRFFQGDGD